jgi:aminopeptidase YwaD
VQTLTLLLNRFSQATLEPIRIIRVKKLILVPLLLCALPACAMHRTASAPVEGKTSQQSIRAHMEFLASDALNGRGSGTRDEWIAVTYVAAQLRMLGLEPLDANGSYVQTVEIERGELAAPPILSAAGERFVHGKDVTVGAMNAARISGPLARFTAGTPVARGVVAVVPEMSPDVAPQLAAAAMVLTKAGGCGPARGPAATLPRLAPRIAGTTPAAARPTCLAFTPERFSAVEKMTAGTTVTLEGEVKNLQKTNTWNAVGQLTGSDPALAKEVILLSAHIDHVGTGRGAPKPGVDTIYNGADDDASGSVAVLELAASLAAGPRPKRTVVFAWFGSEESGGSGSGYFVDKPVVPLDRIVANLQFEMIGRPDAKVPPHTLWLTGYERSNLGSELAKRGAKLVQDPHPEQSFFTRSDNIRFARRGVIAHTVSSFGLHKDYHQPSDELSTIDFAHMTDAIRSMIEPVRWLANSNFRPEWKPGMKP